MRTPILDDFLDFTEKWAKSIEKRNRFASGMFGLTVLAIILYILGILVMRFFQYFVYSFAGS